MKRPKHPGFVHQIRDKSPSAMINVTDDAGGAALRPGRRPFPVSYPGEPVAVGVGEPWPQSPAQAWRKAAVLLDKVNL
jgi:hypothetical protein